jgi:hypothetical protein
MLYLSEEMINIHQITRIFYYTDRRKREKNDTKKELLICAVCLLMLKVEANMRKCTSKSRQLENTNFHQEQKKLP